MEDTAIIEEKTIGVSVCNEGSTYIGSLLLATRSVMDRNSG